MLESIPLWSFDWWAGPWYSLCAVLEFLTECRYPGVLILGKAEAQMERYLGELHPHIDQWRHLFQAEVFEAQRIELDITCGERRTQIRDELWGIQE